MVLLMALVGWAFSVQEEDPLIKLRESVNALTIDNQWDRALDLLRSTSSTTPSLTEDARFKILLRKTRDLAEEAEVLYQQSFKEAEDQLRRAQFAKAIFKAEGALKVYPERRNPVRELEERARRGLAGKDMIRVESKSSWVGSDDHADEKPLREVHLASFLMDLYPVTNEDFAAFAAATGVPVPGAWKTRKPAGREDHPVVFVDYDAAAAFAKWVGKRLPTAEEWEVAARGSDRREFPWGNTFLEDEKRFPANCLDYWQVHKSETPGTTPVTFFFSQGFKSASGAAMGGNVWEWTSTVSPGRIGDQAAEFRILKGGSFMVSSRSLRCATALPENPSLAHPDTGFRCAKDVPQ